MIPISCTSPPHALTAQAWPNSCAALSSGNTRTSTSRFCGASTRLPRSWVSSLQCCQALSAPHPTTASHSSAPNAPNSGRYHGCQRSSRRALRVTLGVERRPARGRHVLADRVDLGHELAVARKHDLAALQE